jgi:hypothetical protein
MIFKPRIFISSTLSENLEVRQELEEYFKSIGAETLIYEKNLTPSTNKLTYRRDILDADFTILIIKNKYGERTESGISGTHEEFLLAQVNKIPQHVYIKLEEDECEAQELIDEINRNKISYYSYKDDNELIKRIKETTFTIAKEIMIRKVESTELPEVTVKKIAVNYDYEKALEVIQIIEAMLYLEKTTSYGVVNSTIFTDFLDPISEHRNIRKWIFVNRRIEDILDEMLVVYRKYSDHAYDYTSIYKTLKEFKHNILGEIYIYKCSVNPQPRKTEEEYIAIVNEFLIIFEKFKAYISEIKMDADLI